MNPSVEKPTNVRYGVLAFACVLSMITYLDRVCFGTVIPTIEKEFDLQPGDRGWLFGAFALAYALFEVPTGWLGDVYGPRKTLIRIVLWWSFFTVLTGSIYPSLPFAFLAMFVVRFMFGIGEAGAYPNIARAFHSWFPFHERGFAKGTVWMAGRFAGGITPFIVLALVYDVPTEGGSIVTHWRHIFWVFGIIGVVWCVVFWWWFRDRPEDCPNVNDAERALIHAGDLSYHPPAPSPSPSLPQPVGTGHPEGRLQVPWMKLLTSPNLWLLCMMYFCAAYGWYFNITYLPGYLKSQFGLEPGEKWTGPWWEFSLMAGLPLLFGSLACVVGGFLTDLFIKRTGDRKWGRRAFGILGHGVCAVCYFLSMTADTAWMFVLFVALASFWNDITMGAAWASCIDIGKRYSGIVSGCMNTIGNLGGFIASVLTDQIIKFFTSGIDRASPDHRIATDYAWSVNFVIFGGVYVVAVFLWMGFDATKPIDTGENS